MRIYKYCAVWLIVCIMLCCSGCQLAQEDTAVENSPSRLIGVLITTEYLDCFDMEKYLTDHTDRIGKDFNLTDTDAYEGRLYAELVSRTLTDQETGESTEIQEYQFSDVQGIAFFVPTVSDTEQGDSFVSTQSEGISNGHFALATGDEERITLEGTVFITSKCAGKSFYINPVYQDAAGSVYALAGQGISQSGDLSAGSRFSTKLEESTTVTVEGESRVATTVVDIGIEVINVPTQVVILQMNDQSEVIERTSYVPGELPEELSLHTDTAYLVVETYGRDASQQIAVGRTLYEQDSTDIETFAAREDGVCVEHWTALVWDS